MRLPIVGILICVVLCSVSAFGDTNVALRLEAAARKQVGVTTIYDPAYVALTYPGGDVALERGVCADVVVRAFRGIGVDLQKLVHEDMKPNFAAYPKNWGLKKPDPNIDHRRVPNLMKFRAPRKDDRRVEESGRFLRGRCGGVAAAGRAVSHRHGRTGAQP